MTFSAPEDLVLTVADDGWKTVAKADKSTMEGVFRKKKGQIEKCYRRVVQKYGKKPGKLVVKLTIGPEGKVEKVEIPCGKSCAGGCTESDTMTFYKLRL